MSAGKGSTPRKVDCGKYAANYEAIFSKPKSEIIVCECGDEKVTHYIYGMICEKCEFQHGDDPYNP